MTKRVYTYIMNHQIDRKELIKCSKCVCFNLRRASRAVTQLYSEIMQASGLRGTQFTLLVVIFSMNSATLSQLANNLMMDRTTLTRNLKPLEKQGLVKIIAGDDRRTRTISLTDKGEKTLAKALPLWEKAQVHVVEGLSQKRWDNMLVDLSVLESVTH